MTRVHDMGGRYGDGPIEQEVAEPTFHEAWEARSLALQLAVGARRHWSLDSFRHAREALSPVDYARFGYYEKWLASLANLALAHGLVTRDELAGSPVRETPLDSKALRPGRWNLCCAGASRERVLAVELTTAEAGEVVTGVLVLPFGLRLDAGVTLAIDEANELDPRRFSTCLPAGCLVPLSFEGNAFAALRDGTTLTVKATANDSGQDVNFSVSLAGFASGLNRLEQLSVR